MEGNEKGVRKSTGEEERDKTGMIIYKNREGKLECKQGENKITDYAIFFTRNAKPTK